MSGKIKVPGYTQKVTYNGDIEYRNFSPDLVGVQLASNGNTPTFTMGNFAITTNMEPKSTKNFITNKFSNFISLTDLDLTLVEANKLLRNNEGVFLNLNRNNLNYYALFGSLTEFVRVSLENIITNWPASLYITPYYTTSEGRSFNTNTFENYTYDSITDMSEFRISTNAINNKFKINYLTNGTILDTFSSTNDLRNLPINYASYVILLNDVEYSVIDFTGATYTQNDYINLKVKGNPFSSSATNGTTIFHIKPNSLKEDEFFNSLEMFENYLLNRLVVPNYTASFKYSVKSDMGALLHVTKLITWPVTDGYNIDFDTNEYINYVSTLIDICNNNDLTSSNLINRFLVSDIITSFDTTPFHFTETDQDATGQKVTKTLNIYGRSFDDLNQYIQGISFANVVSYSKEDNMPDAYIKNLARVLGWETLTSVVENDLLSNYVKTSKSSYSGQTVGLTLIEADTELWRRLILNSPWLWKSKGARKAIEFLIKFTGIPLGLITLNEYVYTADKPIDIDLFKEILKLNGLNNVDLSKYPIDSEGYPIPLADTSDMYFQNYGLWYRQTAGSQSNIDITDGNNPHVGPYDGGSKYINQFKKLIPNFSAVTITSETLTKTSVNLFTNYNAGKITNYTGDTYINGFYSDGTSLNDCVIIKTNIIPDPMPTAEFTECGCIPESDDDSLSICVGKNDKASKPCVDLIGLPRNENNTDIYEFTYKRYDFNGEVYEPSRVTNFASKACCKYWRGMSTLVYENETSTGFYCCSPNSTKCGCNLSHKWVPNINPYYIGDIPYLKFDRRYGQTPTLTTPDGSHCVKYYTTPVPNITDPFTGEIGFGCKLNTSGKYLGVVDLTRGINSYIVGTYNDRNSGKLGPCQDKWDYSYGRV